MGLEGFSLCLSFDRSLSQILDNNVFTEPVRICKDDIVLGPSAYPDWRNFGSQTKGIGRYFKTVTGHHGRCLFIPSAWLKSRFPDG